MRASPAGSDRTCASSAFHAPIGPPSISTRRVRLPVPYSTHRQSPCSAGSIRTRKKPSVLVSIDIDSEPPVGVAEGDDAQRHRQTVEQRFAARIKDQLAELVGVVAAGAQQARENLRSDGDR